MCAQQKHDFLYASDLGQFKIDLLNHINSDNLVHFSEQTKSVITVVFVI